MFKKRNRPVEQLRPGIEAARQSFKRWMKRVDVRRIAILDESSANTKMGRSHAWICGEELVDHQATNWGKPLTMLGSVRVQGWITLGTRWGAVTAHSFVSWFSRFLLPKRRKRSRKFRRIHVHRAAAAEMPNHSWAMDFVSDMALDGRKIRILAVINHCTRQYLALHADHFGMFGEDDRARIEPFDAIELDLAKI